MTAKDLYRVIDLLAHPDFLAFLALDPPAFFAMADWAAEHDCPPLALACRAGLGPVRVGAGLLEIRPASIHPNWKYVRRGSWRGRPHVTERSPGHLYRVLADVAWLLVSPREWAAAKSAVRAGFVCPLKIGDVLTRGGGEEHAVVVKVHRFGATLRPVGGRGRAFTVTYRLIGGGHEWRVAGPFAARDADHPWELRAVTLSGSLECGPGGPPDEPRTNPRGGLSNDPPVVTGSPGATVRAVTRGDIGMSRGGRIIAAPTWGYRRIGPSREPIRAAWSALLAELSRVAGHAVEPPSGGLAACARCRSAFVGIDRPGGRPRYCTDTCRNIERQVHRPSRSSGARLVHCAHCGRRFLRSRADARFCSPRCRVAAHRAT